MNKEKTVELYKQTLKDNNKLMNHFNVKNKIKKEENMKEKLSFRK